VDGSLEQRLNDVNYPGSRLQMMAHGWLEPRTHSDVGGQPLCSVQRAAITQPVKLNAPRALLVTKFLLHPWYGPCKILRSECLCMSACMSARRPLIWLMTDYEPLAEPDTIWTEYNCYRFFIGTQTIRGRLLDAVEDNKMYLHLVTRHLLQHRNSCH